MKPSSRLLIADEVDVVQSVALHHVILKTLGELSQFRRNSSDCQSYKAVFSIPIGFFCNPGVKNNCRCIM